MTYLAQDQDHQKRLLFRKKDVYDPKGLCKHHWCRCD